MAGDIPDGAWDFPTVIPPTVTHIIPPIGAMVGTTTHGTAMDTEVIMEAGGTLTMVGHTGTDIITGIMTAITTAITGMPITDTARLITAIPTDIPGPPQELHLEVPEPPMWIPSRGTARRHTQVQQPVPVHPVLPVPARPLR